MSSSSHVVLHTNMAQIVMEAVEKVSIKLSNSRKKESGIGV
jgi:hypothetical protein